MRDDIGPSQGGQPLTGRERARMISVGVAALLAIILAMTDGRVLGLKVTENAAAPKPPVTSTATSTSTAAPRAQEPAPTPLLPRRTAEFMTPVLQRHFDGATASLDEFWVHAAIRTPEDVSFESWAALTATREPGPEQRLRERASRDQLTSGTDDAKAAAWLSKHGCEDVWLDYASRDAGGGVETTIRRELGEVLGLATRVALSVQKRNDPAATPAAPCTSSRPADPACQCSYPSPAVVQSAAARMYLGNRLPRHDREYAAMEKQIDAAGLVQRRELPSDISEGARLGYLIGRYYLTTRGYAEDTTPTPAASPAV